MYGVRWMRKATARTSAEDDRVQLDAVAHGNHEVEALIVVEDVLDRGSRAVKDLVGTGGFDRRLAVGAKQETECGLWNNNTRN